MSAKTKTRVAPPRHDYYTRYGAGILVSTIEAYWKARGFAGIRAERFAIPGTVELFGVKSNIGLMGLPPRAPVPA